LDTVTFDVRYAVPGAVATFNALYLTPVGAATCRSANGIRSADPVLEGDRC
jgi:hypothetical protein